MQNDQEQQNQNSGSSALDLVQSGKRAFEMAKKGIQLARGLAAGVSAVGGAVASAPVWIPVVAVILVVVVIVVIFAAIILFILNITGGGSAGASGYDGSTPGGAIQVVGDYCQGRANPCSKNLKNIIESASAWAKMPGAILVVVANVEDGRILGLSDGEVDRFSAPGAKTDPCDINPEPVSTGENATGPMQFIPATWTGAGYTYGNAAVEAGVRPAGYTGEICNILDSYYAAAKYLKVNSNIAFDQLKLPWTRDDLAAAVGTYGTCTKNATFDSCVDSLYQLYLNKANTVVGGTDPTGWPTNGQVTQHPYTAAGNSHEKLSAFDISTSPPARIYATQDGVIEFGDSGDPVDSNGDGAYDASELADCRKGTYGCVGFWVTVRGPNYTTLYAHMDRNTAFRKCLKNGEAIKAGTWLGVMGFTGYTIPVGSGGLHLHYEIRNNSNQEIPQADLGKVFPPDYASVTSIATTYTGEDCLK